MNTAPRAATTMKIERRFPLDLHKADDDIRGLYEAAKDARWNPDVDLPWDRNGLAGLAPEALAAARRIWSRRAWVEFTGMTETPALLIRFCLELNRESDPKYFLTVRNTEEAWHVETYHRYAEACGGYIDAPANPAWEPVFNRTLYRAVLERCLADYERHATFGWMYARRRAATMDAQTCGRVAAALQRHIEDVEFAGYHCVALATGIDTTPETADLDAASRAGLGSASAAGEVAIFRDWLRLSRDRFGELGLELPEIRHERLGSL